MIMYIYTHYIGIYDYVYRLYISICKYVLYIRIYVHIEKHVYCNYYIYINTRL